MCKSHEQVMHVADMHDSKSRHTVTTHLLLVKEPLSRAFLEDVHAYLLGFACPIWKILAQNAGLEPPLDPVCFFHQIVSFRFHV